MSDQNSNQSKNVDYTNRRQDVLTDRRDDISPNSYKGPERRTSKIDRREEAKNSKPREDT